MRTRFRSSPRRPFAKATSVFAIAVLLAGCATTHMAIRPRELATQTEVTESVFLDLRTGLAPTVYISVQSTIPQETLNGTEVHVRPTLDMGLRDAGYVVVDDPLEATYIFQVNHRSLVEYDLGEENSLGDAMSSAFTAGLAAGVITDAIFSDAGAEVGLAVGIIGFLLDSYNKHVAHTLTTDIMLTETVALHDEEPEVLYHRTQIVNGASMMNLKITESLPSMIRELSGTLVGMLPERGVPPLGQR